MATVDANKLSFQEIIHEVTRLATQITEKTIPSSREDLFAYGVDSMTMLDLLAVLETHFGITLSENIVREFRTIDRIARIVRDTAGS